MSPGTIKLRGLVTVTVLTGMFTVTADVPKTSAPPWPAPTARASIVADPPAFAVTRPLAETDAMLGADDVHVIVRVNGLPAESRGVAVS